MVCHKSNGMIQIRSFASFSQALWPEAKGGLCRKTVDYSRIDLSRKKALHNALGRRLAAIGAFVEKAFRRPQDIEGAVVGRDIYLLQSRAQQGVQSHPQIVGDND